MHAPIHLGLRRAEEAFKIADISQIAAGRAKEREVAIPVCRPQNRFVRCKDVAMSSRWTSILPLEVFDPIQLPFSAEFISNPKPFVSKVLDIGEHSVVEEV